MSKLFGFSIEDTESLPPNAVSPVAPNDEDGVTIINDEGFILRTAMEEWMNQISKLENNLGATNPQSYMTNAKVYQLGRGSKSSSEDNTGEKNVVLREYEFVDIFPTNISAIDLSYESSDTIEEFTVEFQVQSFSLAGNGSAD